MKRLILSAAIFLSGNMVLAEEQPLFRCHSNVEGFISFTIFQNVEAGEVASGNKLNLKSDFNDAETWTQYGQGTTWANHFLLESQFEKAVPGLPPERIYIYIKQNGYGAISIHSGMDPVFCEKLF